MPTVNEVVAANIRQYPSIFLCRTDVLEHMFCVIGNGMEWHKGTLVSEDPEPKRSLRSQLRRVDEHRAEHARQMGDIFRDRPDLLADMEARWRVSDAREKLEIRFRHENADDLARMTWEHRSFVNADFPPKRIYPLCHYSRMATVPDDVQPDWLGAVREMIGEVFMTNKVVGEEPDTPPEEIAQRRKENIEFASTVLTSLAERFGNPTGEPTNHADWLADQERKKADRARILAEIIAKD